MEKNQHHTLRSPQTVRFAIAACAMPGSAVSAFAADPLYQWNFNHGDANVGTGSGGTLRSMSALWTDPPALA